MHVASLTSPHLAYKVHHCLVWAPSAWDRNMTIPQTASTVKSWGRFALAYSHPEWAAVIPLHIHSVMVT